MPPLLTIGLPVWNAERFLRQTLQSVFAQTLQDWELLVVDDGSSDRSIEVVHAVRDPRVKLFVDRKHLGLATRLNQIAAIAQGEYLARMDADDLMHPRRLEKQISRLRAAPPCDVVGCGMVILDKRGGPAGARQLPLTHDEIISDVLRQTHLAHATALARADWWRKYRYDETAPLGVEDWRFWLDASKTSRFANVPELLYYYREFDSFRLGNYLRNKQGLVARLWRLEDVSPWIAGKETTRHLYRAAAFAGAASLGLSERLIARRNQPLTEAEKRHFAEAIKQIAATNLESQPSNH